MFEPTLRQALGVEPWTCPAGHERELIFSEKEALADRLQDICERLEALEALENKRKGGSS